MEINAANLRTLFTSYRGNFQRGLGTAPNDHEPFTEAVPSTTAEEEYGWLKELPGMREWLGDRVIHQLGAHSYKIVNRKFEQTVGVPRDAIEDDKQGLFAKPMELLGRSAGRQPCEMVYAALLGGRSSLCYDGQFFFDTDHPVLDVNGSPTSVSNFAAGGGQPWFLLCTNEIIKPILFQDRKKAVFTGITGNEDPEVFMKGRFVYGVDARNAAGYALWQTAFCSLQPLNQATFEAALIAIMSMKGDHGRPLGLKPDTLLVGPANLTAGTKVVKTERLANGEDNPMKGMANLVTSPWIS